MTRRIRGPIYWWSAGVRGVGIFLGAGNTTAAAIAAANVSSPLKTRAPGLALTGGS